ncbi:MAG: GntR family transcriptional regulator [Streptosporangiaceae bacterium]
MRTPRQAPRQIDPIGTAGPDLGPLSPAATRSTYEHVYRALRRYLLHNQSGPPRRLVEAELAERLRVSRTPVREALRRLESDGLTARAAGGGLQSVSVQRDDLEDVFLLRLEIDQLAARLAAQRAQPDDWQDARILVESLADYEVGSEDFEDVHLAVHSAIYALAFRPLVDGLLQSGLLLFIELAARFSYDDPNRALPPVPQHLALIDALASGDPQRASQAAAAHAHSAQAASTDSQPEYTPYSHSH